ncbi:MAG: hypothetical protein AB7V55_08430, partial [Oscillospiraceae bacterium]
FEVASQQRFTPMNDGGKAMGIRWLYHSAIGGERQERGKLGKKCRILSCPEGTPHATIILHHME